MTAGAGRGEGPRGCEVGIEGADEGEDAAEEEEGGYGGSGGRFVFGELGGEIGVGDEGGDEADVRVWGGEGGGGVVWGGDAGGDYSREGVEGLWVWGCVC